MHVKRGSGSCGFVINVELEHASLSATAGSSGGRTRLIQTETTRTRQGLMAVRSSGQSTGSTAQVPRLHELLPCVLVQGACRNGRLLGHSLMFSGECAGSASSVQRPAFFIIEACAAQAYRRMRGNCSQAASATEGSGFDLCRSRTSPGCLRVVAAVDRTLTPAFIRARRQSR